MNLQLESTGIVIKTYGKTTGLEIAKRASFIEPWLMLLQFIITLAFFGRNVDMLSNSFPSSINIHLSV
jgi:hypothetical protein